MSDVLKGFSYPSNVFITDYCQDLSELYINASAVIVPVFLGSGMKVKIAEALMYGKKILATQFAFCGYKTNEKGCRICNNSNEFINEINSLDLAEKYFPDSRLLFVNNYSFEQNREYYSRIEEVFYDS
jgi:glycosyltransferase involved in cell wall biosynthesis